MTIRETRLGAALAAASVLFFVRCSARSHAPRELAEGPLAAPADGGDDASAAVIAGACAGRPAGVFCGGSLALEPTSRYACDAAGGARFVAACPRGCISSVPPGNDRCDATDCTGQSGVFCGLKIGGDASYVYTCVDGRLTDARACVSGCSDSAAGLAGVAGCASTPPAPTGVRAAAGSDFAELRWVPAKQATARYRVTGAPGPVAVDVAPTTTRTRIDNLVPGTTYTFTVQADDGLPSVASDPVTPSAYSNVIANVAFHKQLHHGTCEAASLRMVLEHDQIVVAEDALMTSIGVDPRPGNVQAGILHWGDPYAAYVGSPDGAEYSYTGYGTYFSPIAKAAAAAGANVISAGEGVEPAALYDAVIHGHPSVVWVAGDFTYHPPSLTWQTFDGKSLEWHGPVEHAVALVGVTADAVLLNNPTRDTYWQLVSKHDFEAAYSTFDKMAVIVE